MKYIKLTDEGMEKIKNLPFSLKYIAKYLIEGLESIFNGDCSEEQVLSSMGTLKQNAEGRVGKNDVVNYDKACKMLGLKVTNRIGLRRLLDRNGIRQVTINNQYCGFLKSDIEALCDKMNKGIERKERFPRNARK